MLLIHHINLTHFKSLTNNTFHIDVQFFIGIEWILYVIDQFNMMFNLFILIRASQFHFNFSCIQGFLFIIHFVDNAVLMILKIMILTGQIDDNSPTSSYVYWVGMNVTSACFFSAMCTLFLLTIERLAATILINDYEQQERRAISVFLNFLLTTFGVFSCFVNREQDNTKWLIVCVLILNGIALGLHCVLQWWNNSIFVHLRDSVTVSAYSLAQRFQVSENIKSLSMMNKIIIYMGVMNVIVVLSVLFSSFNQTPELQLFLTFSLDVSIFIYSFCYPVIMFYSCERWRFEMNSVFKRIGCTSNGKVGPTLNSLGKQRMEPENTMNNHFDHLCNAWNTDVPRKSLISLDI